VLSQDEEQPAEQRANTLAELTAAIGVHFQETGARWILPAGLAAGRQTLALMTAQDDAFVACASKLSSRIAEAIRAGAEPAASYREALDWQRRAIALTPEGARRPRRS
jgi:hypothetical protein